MGLLKSLRTKYASLTEGPPGNHMRLFFRLPYEHRGRCEGTLARVASQYSHLTLGTESPSRSYGPNQQVDFNVVAPILLQLHSKLADEFRDITDEIHRKPTVRRLE